MNTRFSLFLCLLTVLVLTNFSSVVEASTLNVPSTSYPTIQSGVNSASDGDTVLVADGTYSGDGNRDIDFNGKNITVTSVNGPTKTIIDCGGSASTDGSGNHRGFYIHSGETKATISGFTVKNGYEASTSRDSRYGGGICIINSVAGTITLSNCTVSGNFATNGYSTGIYNENDGAGTITLTNCTVSGNTTPYYGTGVYNENDGAGAITLTNCTVSGNIGGGGVYNRNDYSNGIYGTITLTNCICYQDSWNAISNDGSNYPAIVTYSDIQGSYPGTGNISTDPLFFNASAGDFHLLPNSPCLGAGTPIGAPATDEDGNTRPNPPSIGAYEVTTSTGTPNAPTNPQAVAGDTEVTLIWTAPTGPVTSYTLYRGTSATAPLTLYHSGITVRSFDDTGVTNGTKYNYAVAAVNSTVTGPTTSTISATPLVVPNAPTNLKAAASGGKITLTWTASPGPVNSYSVYRGTTSGAETFYKTAGTAMSFVNTVVTPGTKYYYFVTAINSSGTSASSNEACAAP